MNSYFRKLLAYYAIIIFPTLLFIVYSLITINWFNTANENLFVENLLDILKLSWLTGFLFVFTNLYGFLKYGSPDKSNEASINQFKKYGWNKQNKLIVSYVSYGKNYKALGRSINKTEKLLKKNKINYTIEVVTDIPVKQFITSRKNLIFYLVPRNYQTKLLSRYKARALNFLLEKRKRRLRFVKNTWVLHLDEESILTLSSLAGINSFISNKDNKLSIGQGEIKYNAYEYGKNLLITAIDTVRTGDDLGRFRMQYILFKRPLFGMHGSFFIVPLSIENSITFDLGGKGSITEDSYFALVASDRGINVRWVNGFIREQSPFSVKDLIKQRRRWINGLIFVCMDTKISLLTRSTLQLNMFLWITSWLGPLATILNIILGGSNIPWFQVYLSAIIAGLNTSVYAMGSYRNLVDVKLSTSRKTLLFTFCILLTPISSFIEGVAVCYALLRPVKDFEVIQKNKSTKSRLSFSSIKTRIAYSV